MHDLIGMANRPMKHAKTYFDGNAAITGAFGNYVRDVKEGTFPAEEHSA
jgi:ketopantoate hydroxymethyltransferase